MVEEDEEDEVVEGLDNEQTDHDELTHFMHQLEQTNT